MEKLGSISKYGPWRYRESSGTRLCCRQCIGSPGTSYSELASNMFHHVRLTHARLGAPGVVTSQNGISEANALATLPSGPRAFSLRSPFHRPPFLLLPAVTRCTQLSPGQKNLASGQKLSDKPLLAVRTLCFVCHCEKGRVSHTLHPLPGFAGLLCLEPQVTDIARCRTSLLQTPVLLALGQWPVVRPPRSTMALAHRTHQYSRSLRPSQVMEVDPFLALIAGLPPVNVSCLPTAQVPRP